MIEEACTAIETVSALERRKQALKYARRNKMRYIDRLLNELELLNLADRHEVPPRLALELDRLIAESDTVTVHEGRLDSVGAAMDVLYEIQDSLMDSSADDSLEEG